MKKVNYIFIIFLLFLGCGTPDSPNQEPPPAVEVYLSVNPDEFSFPIGGGAQNVSLISNTSWTVLSDADWCSCSPESGAAGSVNVSVAATVNNTGTTRSAELTFTAGSISKKIIVNQEGVVSLSVSPSEISISADGGSQNVMVTSNLSWEVSSDADWCVFSPESGSSGSRNISVSAAGNYTGAIRFAELTFKVGSISEKCIVSQESTQMPSYVPDGYSLVWQDEFETSNVPNADKWWYETGKSGWGNNELQNYIPGIIGQDTCALVSDGILKIIAKKRGSEIISIRMNTNESWKYGYFEARLKLPSGKGTWPAFWMMPQNFTSWPGDGEIDIMEEVGYRPNYVSSAIHCTAYNHSNGTNKGNETFIATAQSDFHIYALEWTEDYIRTFVDGKELFYFANDKTGNKNTWPFNAAFYLKLNLAWGGNWGGAQGVDESALPTTYSIDYVRVYQKNE